MFRQHYSAEPHHFIDYAGLKPWLEEMDRRKHIRNEIRKKNRRLAGDRARSRSLLLLLLQV